MKTYDFPNMKDWELDRELSRVEEMLRLFIRAGDAPEAVRALSIQKGQLRAEIASRNPNGFPTGVAN